MRLFMGKSMNLNKNLLLVPTRSRPDNAKEVLQAHKEFSCRTDLTFIVDDDDPTLPEYRSAVGVEYIYTVTNKSRGMAWPLNYVAKKFSKSGYEFFSFIGDDHRFRSPDWDVKLMQAIGSKPGIGYGNDLLQGARLPTAVVMSASIVQELEGMVPPNMRHLYLDNFWKQLGEDLGNLNYLSDVIIEHLHPVAGKAEWDEGYREVNAQEVYSYDALAYKNYISGERYSLLLKQLRK